MLHGKRILITAGPTYERIDPVRFIGNFSSGKKAVSLPRIALCKLPRLIAIYMNIVTYV